jgi:hypothetical protein
MSFTEAGKSLDLSFSKPALHIPPGYFPDDFCRFAAPEAPVSLAEDPASKPWLGE